MKKNKPDNKGGRKVDSKTLSEKISRYGYILIFFVALLLYSQTIGFDFTGFEDDYLISKNFENLSNIENLDDIFFKNSFLSEYNLGFYRPMQTLTYMIDAIVAGNNATVFHLTNLLLHCLTCYFVFLLFNKLKYHPGISLSVALLYAVHPLFVHAVVWLPSRGDLLLCLFCVLSFIFLIKYKENNKIINLILHLFSLLLAGLSKETGLLFPAILFFWFFILCKKPIISKNGFWLIGTWSIIISLCNIMRLVTVENILSQEDFGIVPFINNLATIPEVIGKFVIPVNIQVMPNFNFLNTSIGLVVILIIIILFVIKNKYSNSLISAESNILKNDSRNMQILFGLFWFSVLVLPGLFYARKFTDSDHLFDYQDHRNYLPMIGLVIILIELLTPYLSKIKPIQLKTTGILILLIFSSTTFINSTSYKEPISFFNQAIKDNPKISGLYFLRAGIHKESGNLNKSFVDYSQTIRYNPYHSEAYNNRASIMAMQGNYQAALVDYNKSIKLNPEQTESYYNRAVVRKTLGDLNGANEDYSIILKKNPRDYKIFVERGLVSITLNDFNNAIKDFTEAIKIKPDYPESYFNRGTAFLKTGNNEKAIKDFEMNLKINPTNPASYLNCGIAHYRLNHFAVACDYWNKSLSLGNSLANKMIELYCK